MACMRCNRAIPWSHPSSELCLRCENSDLRNELASLRATVAKLPVTADGVTITLGMTVYIYTGRRGRFTINNAIVGRMEQKDCGDAGCNALRWWRTYSEVYSTEAAARAAKGETATAPGFGRPPRGGKTIFAGSIEELGDALANGEIK